MVKFRNKVFLAFGFFTHDCNNNCGLGELRVSGVIDGDQGNKEFYSQLVAESKEF